MARRVNSVKGGEGGGDGAAEITAHEEQTPLHGGSSGILPGALIDPGGAKISGSAARENPDAPVVTVRTFEVYGCGANGRHVLLNGYKCLFRDGKIVTDKDYDIDRLSQQGISLREIKG